MKALPLHFETVQIIIDLLFYEPNKIKICIHSVIERKYPNA